MTSTMLIAEDEEDILRLISAIFDVAGDYRVFWARDGEEALRVARTVKPHIILLDVQLPELDGYEVCRAIKADPAISTARVLMVSGMTQNSDVKRAREAGADDYIPKPFRTAALVEKVETLLRSG